MSNEIIQKEKVADLTILSNAMKQYVSTEDDALLNKELDKIKDKGLLARWFPNKLQKEADRHALEQIKYLHKSKSEFLKTYTEMQLEIAKTNAEILVAGASMAGRAYLTKFASDKIKEITQTLKRGRIEQAADIAALQTDLNQYKDIDFLYERYEKSIKHAVSEYFDFVDKLLSDFKRAIDFRIERGN